MALCEALKRLRLMLTESEAIPNQFGLAGVQAIKSCDTVRGQSQPRPSRFEERQKRIDGAGLGQDRILIPPTPLSQCDSLVDFEGDSTIETRLEFSSGLRVETIEHVGDHFDAETSGPREGLV